MSFRGFLKSHHEFSYGKLGKQPENSATRKGLPFDERKPKKGEEDAAVFAADCACAQS